MASGLIEWARAVRARQDRSRRRIPVLWLFTDPARVPDLRRAVAGLPRGGAGVVFRHDGTSGRETLAHAIAQQCRALGLAMVVAGDARLAASVGAGIHLRGGRWPSGHSGWLRRTAWVTSSAHDRAGLVRARRAKASLIFLSPVWPTLSHPGASTLGLVRWVGIARSSASAGVPVLALGGVTGRRARMLPRRCAGAGAIEALAAPAGLCGAAATVFRNCHNSRKQPVAPVHPARQ